MSHYTRSSARASLCAVGVYMRQKKMWNTVEGLVQIKQKAIKHKAADKLLDALINIFAGGHGVVEVNTRVRTDEGLQRAFGRQTCADQSSISDTLNQCTAENVQQGRQALQQIYQAHSQGYQHNYQHGIQVLDVDMTGLPSGRQGEGATKGYFSRHKNQRGRQLGRVLATLYDEIVAERLYPGKKQLNSSLQELVSAAETVLDLDEEKRQRTVTRIDGGGGKDADVNWLLSRGYYLLAKVNNWKRSAVLARSVTTWYPDPKTGDREVGWVTSPHAYERPTRQLAIRTPKKDGSWLCAVVILNLSDLQLAWLARQPFRAQPTAQQALFAALYAYDLRSGAAETSIKGSKQGLGLTKRNKQRFHAQEMLTLLAQLAYNLLSWTRNHLVAHSPKLRSYGPLRMVRDLLHIIGSIRLDAQGSVLEITLNEAHPLASPFVQAFSSILARDGLSLNLGQI